MSTEYMPSRRIAIERIKDFNHNGVSARLVNGYVLLSDGENCVWAYPPYSGRRATFVRQGDNEVMPIIEALEDYFNVRLITEYEDEFFDIIKTERRIARQLKAKKKTHIDPCA